MTIFLYIISILIIFLGGLTLGVSIGKIKARKEVSTYLEKFSQKKNPMSKKFLMDGNLHDWSERSVWSLDQAKEFIVDYSYVGSSSIMFIDGIKVELDKTNHFFN